MRPDRIIVGECRGAEALDMLQAMNTGVEGSMSTVHANSPRDAFSRLEAMVLMSDIEMPSRVIRNSSRARSVWWCKCRGFRMGLARSSASPKCTGSRTSASTSATFFSLRAMVTEAGKVQGASAAPARAENPGAAAHQRIEVPPQIFDEVVDVNL